MTVTPATARQLMDSGKWEVHVEHSPTRIIKDAEYEQVGVVNSKVGGAERNSKEVGDTVTPASNIRDAKYEHMSAGVKGMNGVRGWKR